MNRNSLTFYLALPAAAFVATAGIAQADPPQWTPVKKGMWKNHLTQQLGERPVSVKTLGPARLHGGSVPVYGHYAQSQSGDAFIAPTPQKINKPQLVQAEFKGLTVKRIGYANEREAMDQASQRINLMSTPQGARHITKHKDAPVVIEVRGNEVLMIEGPRAGDQQLLKKVRDAAWGGPVENRAPQQAVAVFTKPDVEGQRGYSVDLAKPSGAVFENLQRTQRLAREAEDIDPTNFQRTSDSSFEEQLPTGEVASVAQQGDQVSFLMAPSREQARAADTMARSVGGRQVDPLAVNAQAGVPSAQAGAPSDTQAEAPSDTQAEAPSDTQAEAPSGTQAEAPSGTQAEAPIDADNPDAGTSPAVPGQVAQLVDGRAVVLQTDGDGRTQRMVQDGAQTEPYDFVDHGPLASDDPEMVETQREMNEWTAQIRPVTQGVNADEPLDELAEQSDVVAMQSSQTEAPTDTAPAAPVETRDGGSSALDRMSQQIGPNNGRTNSQAGAPSDTQTEAPSSDQAGAPSDTQAEAPTGDQAGAPSDTQAEAPSSDQAGAPSDSQAEAPTGDQAGAPSDTQAEAPAGDQARAPSDTQAEAPAGDQARAPSDTQAEAPAGDRAGAPSDSQAEAPAASQQGAPTGTQAGAPGEIDADALRHELKPDAADAPPLPARELQGLSDSAGEATAQARARELPSTPEEATRIADDEAQAQVAQVFANAFPTVEQQAQADAAQAAAATNDQATPPAGTNDQATPPAGTNDQATPPAGTSDQATPPAGTNDQATPPAGTSDQATPPAGTSDQATPPAGTSDQATPPAGTSDQATPPAGTSDQATPPAGTSDQATPVNQTTPTDPALRAEIDAAATTQGERSQAVSQEIKDALAALQANQASMVKQLEELNQRNAELERKLAQALSGNSIAPTTINPTPIRPDRGPAVGTNLGSTTTSPLDRRNFGTTTPSWNANVPNRPVASYNDYRYDPSRGTYSYGANQPNTGGYTRGRYPLANRDTGSWPYANNGVGTYRGANGVNAYDPTNRGNALNNTGLNLDLNSAPTSTGPTKKELLARYAAGLEDRNAKLRELAARRAAELKANQDRIIASVPPEHRDYVRARLNESTASGGIVKVDPNGNIAPITPSGALTPFTSTPAGFRASFPGTPRQSTTTSNGVTMRTFSVDQGDDRFLITAANGVTNGRTADQILDQARDAGLSSSGGRLIRESKLTVDGAPARELVVETATRFMTIRIVTRGDKLYTVIQSHGKTRQPSASAFTASFRLL